jgi:hypothetical protein
VRDYRTKERDESFTDVVALGNLPSKFFLGKLRISEVFHGPPRCASRLVGCRFDSPCEFFSKGLEVLDKHPAGGSALWFRSADRPPAFVCCVRLPFRRNRSVCRSTSDIRR